MIRKLEALVLVLLTYALFRGQSRTWVILVGLAAVIQAVVEGARFHFAPVWGSFLFLLLSHWRFSALFSVISFLCLVLSALGLYALPLVRLPKPTGRFIVGVRQEQWRSDADKIHTARIWYPAYVPPVSTSQKHAKMFGPFYQEILNNMAKMVGKEARLLPLLQHVRFIHTNAFEDADLARKLDIGPDPIPVILFSHGLYGLPELYASLCEDIASHGFVVAAVHHTDGSSFVVDNTGMRIST
jgi:hypothetical protein